ncbi:hypothetical protein [Streptomyces sp. 6N106]|uniref:hypothetical protein n=1 Tax=Streptomyces sp. 6N106 TaxID=3457418 RepID=UPI003FD2A1FA
MTSAIVFSFTTASMPALRPGTNTRPVCSNTRTISVSREPSLAWAHGNALDDGVQMVRLKLLEQRADPARAAVRDTSAWSSVVASRVAAAWHRAGARNDGLRARLAARWAQQLVAEHGAHVRAAARTAHWPSRWRTGSALCPVTSVRY